MLLAALVSTVACGTDKTTTDSSYYSSSNDFSDSQIEYVASCSSSSELDGTTPAGAACSTEGECVPVCCVCTYDMGDQALNASICQHNVCLGESDICTPPDGEVNSSYCQ